MQFYSERWLNCDKAADTNIVQSDRESRSNQNKKTKISHNSFTKSLIIQQIFEQEAPNMFMQC